MSVTKHQLKCILVGDSNTGKTCLVNRFTNHEFVTCNSTNAASFRYKLCEYKLIKVVLGIWDTPGQTRWDELQSFYCRGAGAAIICYDVTERKSFDNALKWYQKVISEANSDCFICLAATKTDLVKRNSTTTAKTRLKRAVSKREGIQLAKLLKLQYFETSSRLDYNVKECFNTIIKKFVQNIQHNNNYDNISNNSSEPSSPIIYDNNIKMPRHYKNNEDIKNGEKLHLLKVEAPKSSSSNCCTCCILS